MFSGDSTAFVCNNISNQTGMHAQVLYWPKCIPMQYVSRQENYASNEIFPL